MKIWGFVDFFFLELKENSYLNFPHLPKIWWISIPLFLAMAKIINYMWWLHFATYIYCKFFFLYHINSLYISLQSFAIPGPIFLSILSGALFGGVYGFALVCLVKWIISFTFNLNIFSISAQLLELLHAMGFHTPLAEASWLIFFPVSSSTLKKRFKLQKILKLLWNMF